MKLRGRFSRTTRNFLALAGLAFFGYGALPISNLQAKSLNNESLKNWGLKKNEANGIQGVEAVELLKNKPRIRIAIVDTGMDANHPDLANVLKSKTDYGKNLVEVGTLPTDQHGHGTHIAGIIAAKFNPSSGTSGVAPFVEIIPIKYYSDKNTGIKNLENTIQALHLAVESGAQIINYSGGGPEYSDREKKELEAAGKKGILIVAAAGNEKQNTDLKKNAYYPASYGLPNVISVAAIGQDGKLIKSSNWGVESVDVAAPGDNILSTLPNGKYGYLSGTSQATAFVTGEAAILLSENPKLSPEELKATIKASVDPLPALAGKIASGGKINIKKGLLSLRDLKTKSDLLLAKAKPDHSRKIAQSEKGNLLRALSKEAHSE